MNGQDVTSRREGALWFPPHGETLSYDLDGNLTQDARWHYRWDAENRLVQMETTAEARAAGVPTQRLTFIYDHQSRRVRKLVETSPNLPTSPTWSVTSDTRLLYDGWNLLAEFTVTTQPINNQPNTINLLRSYTWGHDLSGTMQGAGGVGGLIAVRQRVGSNEWKAIAPTYDGNGNIVAYLDLATGTALARYDYDAFGKVVIKDESGLGAASQPFQFSTKYTDAETGLSYYGFRYYSPELGRWLSKDPNEENDVNFYAIADNDVINQWDMLGLETLSQFTKRCEQSAKPTCDAKGKLLASWKVVPIGAGVTPSSNGIVLWSRWQCVIKCGNCSIAEKDKRQKIKDLVCGEPRSCESTNHCAKISKCIHNGWSCMEARKWVMDCFDGGDQAHKDELANVRKVFDSCLQKWTELGCSRR